MPDLCKHFRTELPINHEGTCPECGGTGKIITLNVHDSILVTDVTTVKLMRIREFYEKNPLILVLGILLTLISSFIGLVRSDYKGFIAGLVVG